MDARPTIQNRLVKCGGRPLSIATYDSRGAAVTVEVTAVHGADVRPAAPVDIEDASQETPMSLACGSTRDLCAFKASGKPVVYRLHAYHPGDKPPKGEEAQKEVKPVELRSGTRSIRPAKLRSGLRSARQRAR